MDNLSEAYLSVYQNLDEANSTETPLQKIRRRNKEYFRNNPETEQKTTQRRAEHKSTRGIKKGKGAKSAFGTMRHVGGPYKEEMEIDLFDYLLEYLITEGYADTNENAIAIMGNMSEEWRTEILDEAYVDWNKGRLSSGRSPREAASRRADSAPAKARIAGGSPQQVSRANQRRTKIKNVSDEMDSHTGIGGKINKLLSPGLGNRAGASPRVAYGEPNTDRHQQARFKRGQPSTYG